jgi:hypothetical protein
LISVPLTKPRTVWACQPVAFMISFSVAPSCLLGTHIGGRPKQHGFPGEDTERGRVGEVNPGRIGGESLGKTEVKHLHLAVRRDLDVGGFKVAVDDPALVRRFQGINELVDDGEEFVYRKRSVSPGTYSIASARVQLNSSNP